MKFDKHLLFSGQGRVIYVVGSYRLGKSVFSVALPWVIYTSTHSTVLSGVAFASLMLPLALFFPIAGWLVDKVGRNHLLIPIEVARMLSFVGLELVLRLNRGVVIDSLLFVAIIQGAADALYTVSLNGMVRDTTVNNQQLTTVNSMVEVAGRIGQLGGPLIASILLSSDHTAWAFSIPFLLSVLTTVLFVTIPDRVDPSNRRDRTAILAGFVHLVKHRLILIMTLIAMITNISVAILGAQLVFYLRSRGISGFSAGIALDMGSIGILSVGVLAPKLIVWLPKQLIVGGSIFLMGLGMSLVAYHGNVLILFAALALAHGPVVIYNAFMQSQIQQLVPRNVLGRIGGAIGSLATVSMPAAGFVSGLLAQRIGLTTTIFTAGLITLVSALAGSILLRPFMGSVMTTINRHQ